MKRLCYFFFMMIVSFQFISVQAILSDNRQELVRCDLDFDALERDMIDSGLDEQIQVAQPSKIIVFLRKMVDPLMVRFILACDYTRTKWQAFMLALHKKINPAGIRQS